jgi:SagB-type dehydrogenase family enzyme
MDKKTRVRKVLEYHQQTKHRPDRFARGPGQMDWANEPVPFRFYEGVIPVHLPLRKRDPDHAYVSLYTRSGCTALPFELKHIASFLELSLGLSAWKEYGGSKWALRMNPSSGNLHPTEAYPVLPPMPGTGNGGGVFHYNPYYHGLEPRIRFGRDLWLRISDNFGCEVFFVGLSSIHWRESWKYGERAYRYCNQDVGHAIACLGFAAGLHGWKVRWLNSLSDREAGKVLGFDRTEWLPQEKEYADLLLVIHRKDEELKSTALPASSLTDFASLPCEGKPNTLSRVHREWRIIDETAAAAEKLSAGPAACRFDNTPYLPFPSAAAASVIRQRRSAQDFDGRTGMDRESFFSILDRTVPRAECSPFDACPGDAAVHLLIFAHRIRGIDQGIYFLIRNGKDLSDLKNRCRHSFLWQKAAGTPDHLGLYLLDKGDFRNIAATASCYQDIASDSAFAVAMIAKFRENIDEEPFSYRRLHWEAGMIGQVLYLEAEAIGLRGTGIGCFLDDVAHEVLGFEDDAYQDIYHFTVGGAVEDKRITTLPPYHHRGAPSGE